MVRRPASTSVLFLLAWIALWNAHANAQPQFVDVAAEAGVDWLHWDGVMPDDIPPGDREVWRMAGGAAAGDFDGDGWTDLFVTRIGQPNLLFRNRGDGTFQQAGHAAGIDLATISTGCTVGDIDGDGDVDIYVMTGSPDSRSYLYINDGTGRFTEDAVARGVSLYEEGSTHRCTSAAFGDYDLDGDLDLLTAAWQLTDSKNLLFRNRGDGHFDEVTTEAGLHLTDSYGFSPRFADVTNDGWPDYLLVGDYGTSCLYKNLGDGTFTNLRPLAQIGTEQNGMGSAVGDVDNDGDLDWFVTSIFDLGSPLHVNHQYWGKTGNRLWRNTGHGLFYDDTDFCGVRNGDWGWASTFFDCDNDGDLDLGMTNGMSFPWVPWENEFHTDRMRMWQNNGDGTMNEIGEICGIDDRGTGKGFLTFDYDRDGDLDVFVTNNAGTPVLYRNDGGNANDWLQVRLHGTKTNRLGIGARVYVQVEDGGPTQMREVSGGTNFMSQNDVVQHFGLGARSVTTIDRVRVVWPASGTETILVNVTPNQRLDITETP